MPVDMSNYPSNWKTEIRPAILERAQHKCEWCGLPNYAMVLRSTTNPDGFIYQPKDDDCHYFQDGTPMRLSEMPDEYGDSEYKRVVLTIAHIHDPNPSNCDPDNLRALCQKCHNKYDMPMRQKNAKRTRLSKKRQAIQATGQMELFT